jgi:hypothetical protein
MMFLKQSTASQSVLIGPYVDETDGTTALTGLTIANTDIRLSANGGNTAAKNSGGGTHDELGLYTITLDATDTATVGRLQLYSKPTGSLLVYQEFWVLEEAIYDALFAASATGALPVSTGGIAAAAFAAGAIDAAAIANGAIDAATFAADVDAEFLSYIVDDATRIDASALNTAAVTSIPAILVDTGTTLDGKIDAILTDTGTTLDTAIGNLPTNAELATALAGLFTTQLADVYAANGVAPTLQQCLMAMHQHMMAFEYTGTTRTTFKIDGSTTAFESELDSASSPTSELREAA